MWKSQLWEDVREMHQVDKAPPRKGKEQETTKAICSGHVTSLHIFLGGKWLMKSCLCKTLDCLYKASADNAHFMCTNN